MIHTLDYYWRKLKSSSCDHLVFRYSTKPYRDQSHEPSVSSLLVFQRRTTHFRQAKEREFPSQPIVCGI